MNYVAITILNSVSSVFMEVKKGLLPFRIQKALFSTTN